MLELLDARGEPGPARLERPTAPPSSDLESEVRKVVADVRLRGDRAVVEHSKLDGIVLPPDRIRVEPDTVDRARGLVSAELIAAMEAMAVSCRQRGERGLPHSWLDQDDDELVGELVRPLRRVGIYAANRSGHLSALIGAAMAARSAGVEGIAVCSPAGASGEIGEGTLAACSVAEVDEVYRIGGAPAIAAVAYGTESVRPVESVIGDGGPRVACAQRLVRGWVRTGPESGPFELVIVADETSSPLLVAADLLASAARGPGGTHAVLTPAGDLLEEVGAALNAQMTSFADAEDIENGLIEGGRGVFVRDLDHALETVNAFAPQLLVLAVSHPEEALPRVRNAAAVVLGQTTPPASLSSLTGAGAILPTLGTARWDSGLSARDFVTIIPVARAGATTLRQAAPHLRALAEAEGSPADRLAIGLKLPS